MKYTITNDHHTELQSAIESVIRKHGIDKVQAYKLGLANDERVRDLEKRFRWDLLWACGQAFTGEWTRKVYRYANDEHIDTSLRRIVQTLNV